MPDTLHPPYAAGATTIPRTLVRWLDINAQNGALARAQTYITLPAFSYTPSAWTGVSDLIATFNCESPNAFSFTGLLSILPSSPNYVLYVSHRVGGDVTRYLLWDAVGSVLTQPALVYINQLIKKNFRFEIWSTSQSLVSQALPINFYTTVKARQDYRYAVDSPLVAVDAVNTIFSFPLPSALPLTLPPTSVSVTN